MSTKKPTPAQLRWLQRIDRGGVLRYGHSWVNALSARGARSTYVMTCALHDSGWIDAERVGNLYEYRVFLTDSGRATLPTTKGKKP